MVILPISNYFNYFSNIIYKQNSTFDHASILNNYLEDNVYPRYSDRQEINDSLRGIRDKVEDIKF